MAQDWFADNAPAQPSSASGGDWFAQNAPDTGASITNGQAANTGQADVAHQPVSLSGLGQTLTSKEGLQAAADPLVGFVKGIGDTVHGTGELIRKGGNAVHAGLGDKIVPPVGQNALEQASTDTNGAQHVGKALEMVTEAMTGDGALDEAGKAMSLGDKMKKLGAITSFMEKHPIIAKMIVGGGKGAVLGGGQTAVKTGGDTPATAEGAAAGTVGGAAIEGAGQGVKYIRDLYRPLAKNTSLADVQPVLQKGIRDTLSDVATKSSVKPAASSSIRDVVADTAEGVKQKSQPIFQAVDTASNGEFSNAQAAAKKYSGALDKAGKDAYEAALQKQDALFQKYVNSPNAAHSPADLAQAKADWRQYRALQEVDDAVKASTVGQRPEVAAGGKQPAENVNPKMLLNKLNRLYNDGTLETAVGKDSAHALLQHAGSAQTTAEDIAYNVRQSNAARVAKGKTVKNIATAAAIGTPSAVLAAEGIKSALGSK